MTSFMTRLTQRFTTFDFHGQLTLQALVRRTATAALAPAVILCAKPAIAQAAPATPVRVIAVEEKMLAVTETVMGNLYSRQESPITASIDGKLLWIAEAGTRVQAGDKLAVFDKKPMLLQENEQLAVIKRAKVQLEYLVKELARLATLKSSNIASQTQLEDVMLRHQLTESDIEIAEARLQQIRERLRRAEIVAPHAGIVLERMHYAGEDLRTGEILTQLINPQQLELRVPAPMKHLAQLQVGRSVMLSDGKRELKGNIRAFVPRRGPRSQTVDLRINVPATKHWTIGQLVSAKLPVSSGHMTLAVHRDALILRNSGSFVVKIDEDNTAHRVPVQIGQGQGDWLAIEQPGQPLKAGDRVAIRGAEMLKEGDRVVIQVVAS